MFPYRLGGYPMGHMIEKKGDHLARVKRIAGQVSAVERGLDRDAGCAEILHLVAAVRGAVNGLLDEGTTTRTGEQLVEALGGLGATLSSGGGGETSFVSLSALKPALFPSMGLDRKSKSLNSSH